MKKTPIKWLDIPPVWLLAALGAAYGLRGLTPSVPFFESGIAQGLALITIGIGFGLMVLAAFEMSRQRTTVIPHLEASHLVQTGIFKYSRNPIYLGDMLLLVGFIVRWNVPVAIVFVPLLFWALKTRFILTEEERLLRAFGDEFEAYTQTTRRWI